MVITHAWPALCGLLLSLALALSVRRSRHRQAAALASIACAELVMLLALLDGASLHEVLVYLLLPLWLLLPEERKS